MGTKERERRSSLERALSIGAVVLPFVAILFFLLWPKEEIARRFTDGGGNVVTYDDHMGLRVAVMVIGVAGSMVLEVIAGRISSRRSP